MACQTVSEKWRMKWCKSKVSGHEWLEPDKFLGWEVSGGRWVRRRFRTEEAARQEAKERIAFDKKFPEGGAE